MTKYLEATAWLTTAGLWGAFLGYPLHELQSTRWVFLGYSVPVYYFFTVIPILIAFALALAAKRRWSRWELLWAAVPLTAIPGLLHRPDFLWSLRQWFSWMVRGVLPGGILLMTFKGGRSKSVMSYWLYPIIIAAAVLGLYEFQTGHNPFFSDSLMPTHFAQTLQPENPFYRPVDPSFVDSLSLLPRGTQGNRIPYAATLVAFLPIGLWLAKYQRRFKKAWLLSVVVLLATIVVAQVRAVWIGALAIAALLPAALSWDRRDLRSAGSGLAASLAAVAAWPKGRHFVWERLHSFHWALFRSRWDALGTIRALRNVWLAGVGFGQYPTRCLPYYRSSYAWSGTPDNQYLRWALENGIFSALAMAVLLAWLIRSGWKRTSRMADQESSDFYRCLLAGWVGLAVSFFFFDGFYWGACNYTFWGLLGLFGTCLDEGGAQAG